MSNPQSQQSNCEDIPDMGYSLTSFSTKQSTPDRGDGFGGRQDETSQALADRGPSFVGLDEAKEDTGDVEMTDYDVKPRYTDPSPISCFPKPLSLSYMNFNTHFRSYGVQGGERVEVGCALISTLLRHYFPTPEFEIQRLPFQLDSLIVTVPVSSTFYWIVTGSDTTKVTDPERATLQVPAFHLNDVREDSIFSREQSPSSTSVKILVAVITDNHFFQRPQRKTPSKLEFTKTATKADGSIWFQDYEFQKGQVVVLGGQKDPIRPSFEFYTMHTDYKGKKSLSPWSGQVTSQINGFHTNIFSLEVEEAHKVDEVFKAILSCARETLPVIPDTPGRPEQSRIHPPAPPLTYFQEHASPPATPEWATEGQLNKDEKWLLSLSQKSDGGIINSRTGHLVGKALQIKAMQMAATLGHHFPLTKAELKRKRLNAGD
jgi:hypothetical protein